MSKAMVAGVAAALVVALAWWLDARHQPDRLIEGGDGGGLPIAPPADEHLDAEVLARIDSQLGGATRILLVARHGHVLVQHYAAGASAQSRIDGGTMSEALAMLVAGVAVHQGVLPLTQVLSTPPAQLPERIARAMHDTYAHVLTRQVWARLNAAPAELSASGAIAARAQDWLRVGMLLLDDGQFEGERIVPAGWSAVMRTPAAAQQAGRGVWLARAVRGADVAPTDGTFFLRGPGQLRLWLLPEYDLAILFDAAQPVDETRIANLVFRSIQDRAPTTPAASLRALVPAH